MNGIRDPLNSAAAAAGVASTGTSSLWQITRSGGKVSSITAPEPSSGAAPPGAHPSAYGSGWAEVSQAGFSPPTGMGRRSQSHTTRRARSWVEPDRTAWRLRRLGPRRVVSCRVSLRVSRRRTSTTCSAVRPARGVPPRSGGGLGRRWRPTAAKQALTPHPTTAFDEGYVGVAAVWRGTATTGGQSKYTTGFPRCPR